MVDIYSDLNWTKSRVARDEHLRFGFSMASFGLDPGRRRILLSIEVKLQFASPLSAPTATAQEAGPQLPACQHPRGLR